MSELETIPCAIYTRKSNARGLEREFNSLDAQREAAESYLSSQRAQGYVVLPDRYDDGGFTGGNVERPGLRRLMADIEAGRVKCVVVYKVDRLSRSLADFTRMMDKFNQHNVSFISVTQHFNTATSMGRLTLNILSSFAQFEREVSAERIRDKITMQKAKGKHCGGVPPLGYDLVDHKYVVNPAEAATVKMIFRRFAECGSATLLIRELAATGVRTKSWTTVRGIRREGHAFDKGYIHRLLHNRVYLGVVTHGEQLYPGEHEAIIDQAAWDKAHAVFAQDGRKRANLTRGPSRHLLRGLLHCGHCGKAMMPTYTTKNGRQYRYYLCGHAAKNGHDQCELKIVQAHLIEDAVMRPLRRWLSSPALKSQVLRMTEREGVDATPQAVADAIAGLDETWEHLFPAEQTRLFQLLVERIDVRTNGLRLCLRDIGLKTLIEEMGGTARQEAGLKDMAETQYPGTEPADRIVANCGDLPGDAAGLAASFAVPLQPAPDSQGFLPAEPFVPTGPVIHAPLRISRRCGRKVIITPNAPDNSVAPGIDANAPLDRTTPGNAEGKATPPNSMIQTLAKAFAWQRKLDKGEFRTFEDLARHLGLSRPHLMRVLRLTLLAPDIIEAILDECEPANLSTHALLHANLPLEWPQQRQTLGFPAVTARNQP